MRLASTEKFWRLIATEVPARAALATPRDLEVQSREHLAEAVRLRCVSDVSACAFLPGAMDSSTIVALNEAATAEMFERSL